MLTVTFASESLGLEINERPSNLSWLLRSHGSSCFISLISFGVIFFPNEKWLIIWDMFIWEASNEWEAERADTTRLPGTCIRQSNLNPTNTMNMETNNLTYRHTRFCHLHVDYLSSQTKKERGGRKEKEKPYPETYEKSLYFRVQQG